MSFDTRMYVNYNSIKNEDDDRSDDNTKGIME